jgi:hypothetical protein
VRSLSASVAAPARGGCIRIHLRWRGADRGGNGSGLIAWIRAWACGAPSRTPQLRRQASRGFAKALACSGPVRSAFSICSSIGSSPSTAARSSTAGSSANVPVASPGRAHHPVRHGARHRCAERIASAGRSLDLPAGRVPRHSLAGMPRSGSAGRVGSEAVKRGDPQISPEIAPVPKEQP